MAAGLVICAIVLAICTVIVLLVMRKDIKNEELAQKKGKKK